MNLSKVPPIQQKRIVEFVNNFVISTVSFLDTFSNNCEISLQRLDIKLRKVEAELSILESKLNSVPALKATSTSAVSTSSTVSAPAPPVVPAPAPPVVPVPAPDPAPGAVSTAGETPPPAPAPLPEPQPAVSSTVEAAPADQMDSKAEEVPAELKRFHKMVQVGVPVQAVKLKMKAEGFDPALLDS